MLCVLLPSLYIHICTFVHFLIDTSNTILFFCLWVLLQRFHVSIENTKNMSKFTHGLLQKLSEESSRLEKHATQADDVQMKSITEFQKAFEVQFQYPSLFYYCFYYYFYSMLTCFIHSGAVKI